MLKKKLENILDTTSEPFRDWALEEISKPARFEALLDEIYDNMDEFYLKPLHTIKDQLREKMRLGALEHGHPQTDPDKIQAELNMEYLDLLGWMLMKKYAQRVLSNTLDK